MTYKEIVDRFETVADSHYMINDFGYGQLSDIKVRSQDQEADYPYMFLNPTTHNRNGVVLSYNFNLIMMDIATDEGDEFSNFLAIQSKCTQYIDDVIAELYYGYQDKPEINMSNINYTVFKERFQDSVAGVTATITIDVPTPINLCIAPIAPPPVPPVDCVLSEWSEYSFCVDDIQFRTRTIVQQPEGAGVPCGELIEFRACVPEPCNLIASVANINNPQIFDSELFGSPIGADTIILDTYNGWRPIAEGGNFYQPKTFDPLTWTISGVIRLYEPLVLPGDVFPTPFKIEDQSTGNIYTPTLVIGWPTEMPAFGAEFPFTLIFDNIPVTNITGGFQAAIIGDDPAIQEASIELLKGVTIEICQTGVITPVVPTYEALVYSNTTTTQLANTNAAFIFQTEASDEAYFIGGAFSNFYGQQVVDFLSVVSFEGTMTYAPGFDPSMFQLAIYNQVTDLFVALVDLPLTDGTVSIITDEFLFPHPTLDPFGNPDQERLTLTLYKKGSANPNATPPASFANPLTFNGTFKIKVNN